MDKPFRYKFDFCLIFNLQGCKWTVVSQYFAKVITFVKSWCDDHICQVLRKYTWMSFAGCPKRYSISDCYAVTFLDIHCNNICNIPFPKNESNWQIHRMIRWCNQRKLIWLHHRMIRWCNQMSFLDIIHQDYTLACICIGAKFVTMHPQPVSKMCLLQCRIASHTCP